MARLEKSMGVIMRLENGSYFGVADYTRWENAKWYQKILGRIYKPYKKKFIDITPLNAEYVGNGTYKLEVQEISRTEIDTNWSIMGNIENE